ncbi:helix-turn-helix domain-containing protein [Amycolatopsis sp. YIM 10]|uniref:MarR family transcriptional regulator n=1 Tax=Amycolatopsis sp. YIM 10 TaxID=2653857 RepID=UPI0012907679|nr:helix-turn-helix domain-containing protein [Amycolatopsis sp. YIM 10]QFU91969.1 MarR family protein [Amycolatopsis sp. YIM 10]
MPGPRLTHEERRRIARWLADGLGYAEIGRRLDRPTSTISREVARNGTSGDYRPDHAQQVAGHRARRSKPAKPAEPEQDGTSGGFVDRFAGLLAATGMPRMTARVFVCLLTADRGLTAAELVRRLRVSPASVSKSIGYLEAMGLVVRQADPGERRERYGVDDEVWLRAWQTDTGAHREIATAARQGAEIFGAGTTAAARFGEMARFFGRLSEQMDGSTLADSVVYDALTVIAALAHGGRPLTPDVLASALGWSLDRTIAALGAIREQPAIADPLALEEIGDGTCALVARPDRLNGVQRRAITDAGSSRVPW